MMNKWFFYIIVFSATFSINIFAKNSAPDLSKLSVHASGDVSGTWNADTVYVDDNIRVPKGSTLEITAGTNVYFTGQYEFKIEGQLLAKGLETDSIFFFADSLGNDHNAQYYTPVGHWYGLGFENTDANSSPKSELEYCDFKYALTKANNDWQIADDPNHPARNSDSVGVPIRLYHSSNVSLNHIHISYCDAFVFGNIHVVHSAGELSNINVENCTGNSVELRDYSITQLSHSTFAHKLVYIYNSSPILDSLIFENIKTTALRAHKFGGIIKNSIFRNNIYAWNHSGGAILLDDSSSAVIKNVQFFGNKNIYDDGWYGYGGAGYIHDSSPKFINCTFIENEAYGYGSALAVLSDNMDQQWVTTLKNCLFVKNRVVVQNGTIITGGRAIINMVNCTMADNTAPAQAAIGNDSGTPNIITNSIIYHNGPDYDQQLSPHQSTHILTYNIIQGDYYGRDTSETDTNLHDIDPLFRDTSKVDYHLKNIACGYAVNSPAIDAAHPDSLDYRLACDAGLGTSRADMGFYGGGYSGTITSVDNERDTKFTSPLKCKLAQNYPNPFNPITNFTYQLPITNYVDLTIYNILGEKVATLVSKTQNAGTHKIQWNASGLASGIYLYKLTINNGYSKIKKLVLLK